MTADSEVLTVNSLKAYYRTKYFGVDREVRAVDDITLSVRKNEIYGIAGESSSGKTTLIKTFAAAIRPPLRIVGGSMTYHFKNGDIDPYAAAKAEVDALRWKHLSYIMQGSMSLLNPVRRVRRTFEDFAFRPMGLPSSEFWGRVEAHLQRLGLSPDVLSAYPHQLSGGMRQRVTIALATVCQPEFVIADEPTTALDVVVQKDVLAMIRDVQRQMGSSVVFVTHDMSVHANTADRIGIMYAGRLVEEAPTSTLFAAPRHPYAHLVAALPHASATPRPNRRSRDGRPTCRTAHGLPLSPSMPLAIGEVPTGAWITGRRAGAAPTCLRSQVGSQRQRWRSSDDRCSKFLTCPSASSWAASSAAMSMPSSMPISVVVRRLRDLHDHRRVRSGKTTLARMILGLEQPTSGDILFEGKSNGTSKPRRPAPSSAACSRSSRTRSKRSIRSSGSIATSMHRRVVSVGARTKAAAEAVMDDALHKSD